MSAPPQNLPPIAVQVAEISTGLNAAMLLTFLMGIYTTVYFGSMYLYLTRKASQTAMVTSTITMLYLLNVVQLAIQWQLLQSSFVDNGGTRETIFITTFSNPGWATLTSQICTFITNILADGLLIWRCFYVWDRSLHAIALPFFLLVAETGIYMSVIIFASVAKLNPSFSQAIILDDLLGAGYFISFSSTVASTILIAYKIYYSLSNQDGRSRKRFTHIVDILVQSAAAYSLTLLITAIAAVIPNTAEDVLPLFAVLNYESSALLFFISGVAPTIMVARVAHAADTAVPAASTNAPISGLQFQGHSTADSDTDGRLGSTIVIDHSPHESEKKMV